MSTPSSLASVLQDPASSPDGLRTWNGSDPTLRFNVHRNNIRAGLVDVLGETFPVCLALVGEEFFRAMTSRFVIAHPPASPVICQYGVALPAFIADFAPVASLPWLPDVARLEWLRVEAFHARDAEPMAAGAFESMMATPESLPALRLDLHPATRLLRSSYAVRALWLAHQGEGGAHVAIDMQSPEDVLIGRPAHVVGVSVLAPGQLEFLASLGAGMSLGEAAAAASDIAGFDLGRMLALCIEQGVLAASPQR